MKNIILILLYPVLLFSQVYWANLPCNDNAATTVITNNGSGGPWATNPIHTTSTYAHISYGGNFWLQQNSYYIKSTENWTDGQKIELQWTARFYNNPSVLHEHHWNFGDSDGNSLTANNGSFFIRRITGSDEWTFTVVDNSGNSRNKSTTDFSTDNTTMHMYRASIDLSVTPAEIILVVDGTTLTWGSWDTAPTTCTLASALVYFGAANVYEPDVFVNNILIWPTPAATDETKRKFGSYDGWGGW